jgi:hypothetical protein
MKMRLWVSVGLLLMPAAGCATHARQMSGAEATHVTLTGTARDAKLGAMLILDNGKALAVDGLDAWPVELHGKRVVVTGVLEERVDLPAFESRPGEPQRTGIPVPPGGDVDAARRHTVIANARFELAR